MQHGGTLKGNHIPPGLTMSAWAVTKDERKILPKGTHLTLCNPIFTFSTSKKQQQITYTWAEVNKG